MVCFWALQQPTATINNMESANFKRHDLARAQYSRFGFQISHVFLKLQHRFGKFVSRQIWLRQL